ncbi:carbohydrate-binding protein [Massilia sp. DJPM01]|uniref:carbohydrate-binding protein n=1 Tax=Massilia sp. DJPM01 TaxID=3024404 RepID=UPI00259D6C1C|nr:carbohydrate-binding protein [Massilia sp. DJPM01]MDM5178064.1 carbohydrate-binding protein [Massilia sp. DJPM01]
MALPRLAGTLAGALFSAACAAQTALPGKLEAESYASMQGVATEATSDAGGGANVGWIETNDWMNYSVNPATSGWYTVQYRVASAGSSGRLVLSQNAKDISDTVGVPNTGGWQTWSTISSRVFLNAGPQNLAVFAKGGGFNLNWINFTAEHPSVGLPAIRQNGRYWVDSSGKRVNLRGVNLGNWLQMEFWMLNDRMVTNSGPVNDQCTLEGTLAGRFGNLEKERLMDAFRDSWITTRDFDLMKGMGMNVIRVPFYFGVVENEYSPYNLRPNAWKYLDFAINEAEKRGMYVILDLHGTVGGQAGEKEQHDGCVGPAQLWSNAGYRDRTKWLWDKVAERYRGRNAVAAYDLLNEPWGTDAATLANYAYELFNVVRAKDPHHMILLPGHNSGIDAYGNPNTRGLSNVALGMHFYPGLWGWNDAPGAANQANVHAAWLHCNLNGTGESCDWNAKLTGLNTPFLIGEFQPWTMLGSYGGQVTRRTYDAYNMYGWAATNWAYKTVSTGGSNGDTSWWGWGMVTNSSNGGGLGSLNVSTASAGQIENYFRGFATQPLVRNESIAYWMNWKPLVGERIEAEMFTTHSGMRMETTSDTGGGFNVSNIDNNDWMSYPVNVPRAGWYKLQFRLASIYNGGQFVLSKNASDLATLTVPNTGGWQNWQTVTGRVYLEAGQQDLTIFARVGGWNMNWWQLNAE